VRSASTASGTARAVANGLHCEFCSSWVVLSQLLRPWRWLTPAPPVVAVGVAGLAGLAAGGAEGGRAGSGIPYRESPARLCQASASSRRPERIRRLNQLRRPAFARLLGLPRFSGFTVRPRLFGRGSGDSGEEAGERAGAGGKAGAME